MCKTLGLPWELYFFAFDRAPNFFDVKRENFATQDEWEQLHMLILKEGRILGQLLLCQPLAPIFCSFGV